MTQPPYQEPGPYPEQDPQAGSKFGTEGYAPGAFGGPVPEPKKFQTLKTLTLVGLGVYVLSGIVGFIPLFGDDAEQQLRDEYAAQGMSLDDSMIQGALLAGAIFAGVFLLIGVALYLLVYFGLRARKNWARIVGIVFAIIGIVFIGGSVLIDIGMAFSSGVAIVGTLLSLATALISIYWLVLAFDGRVKAYLQQR